MDVQFRCVPFYELSVDELYAIFALRMAVFVVEQDCPYQDADGRDQAAWHLMGHHADGHLLAYARLLPVGVSYPEHASIGRVITAGAARGTGLGRQLMQEAIAHTAQLFGDAPVKIGAQNYALPFYESLGFRAVGETYLEDDIPHTAMILET